MATIKNVRWDCTITLTRAEVQVLGVLCKFAGNIESDYKTAFPSAFRNIDWEHVRTAFGKFKRVADADAAFCEAVKSAEAPDAS